MFLRVLSGREYEEEYWPFVLRLETLAAGIIIEAAKHIDQLDEGQARHYFENAFAACFKTSMEAYGESWWGESIPSIDWFWNYFDQEYPSMLQESQRIAREKIEKPVPDFDRLKIRELAHHSESFHHFLDRYGLQ